MAKQQEMAEDPVLALIQKTTQDLSRLREAKSGRLSKENVESLLKVLKDDVAEIDAGVRSCRLTFGLQPLKTKGSL